MKQKKRVIALGFFDGVHIGHSALLERTLDISAQKGLVASVITYDMHPLSVVSGKRVPLINSAEDRARLMQSIFGIDDVIILHFDLETASMPWDEFVQTLVLEFGAEHLVAGHDHRFGQFGEGTSELLAAKCAELGIGCDIIPPVVYKGEISSSTIIRKFLLDGDIAAANEYLGHPHILTDYVRYGYRLGRELGTPTINMTFGDGVLIPAHGVYATRVCLGDGVRRIGVTNIGTRPTVSSSNSVTAETHILDYQGNLYGKPVRLEFFAKIRGELKFANTEELRAQILRDCDAVRTFFEENK